MKIIRIASAILVCLAMTHSVAAQNSRRTKVRFNAPVEIPSYDAKSGVMSLPPGEYMFQLADSSSSRHIVRVTDATGKKVYSMIMTIPDYRLNATSKTVMYLGERPAGSPAALKSWFYPGENTGERFIYPKAKAQALAAEVKQPVPSRDAAGPGATHEVVPVQTATRAQGRVATPAGVQVQTPARTEVPYHPKLFEPLDAGDSAGVEGEAVQLASAAGGATLPKTASNVYGVGLAGLLLLGAGLAVRRSAFLGSRA